LASGSSNSDQPLSTAATLAPKLAKPLGMAPPPLFLDLVTLIRIDHHFVLFMFCVNKVIQKLGFCVSTSLSSYKVGIWKAGSSSTVVEHSPHYRKITFSIPAMTAGTGIQNDKKLEFKLIF
jgi:hypothetical protein